MGNFFLHLESGSVCRFSDSLTITTSLHVRNCIIAALNTDFSYTFEQKVSLFFLTLIHCQLQLAVSPRTRVFTLTMAAFQTPRDNSTSPPNNADFQTPLWLRSLNTPTSTSSIQSSPSDLTPPIAAFPNLALSSPIKPIPTATMDDFEDSPEYDNTDFADNTDATAPLPDLHSKLEDATPRYSRTNAYNSLTHAISSAKMLHQVLGIQPPEPYQRPPEMPNTLGQRFAASLVEYGLDREMQGLGLQRNTGPMKEVSVGAALGKAVLEDIREEKESPVKATHQGAGLDGRPVGLMNKAPVWHTERETTTGCHASVSKEGLRTNGNLNNQNGHQLNVLPRERPATAHSSKYTHCRVA